MTSVNPSSFPLREHDCQIRVRYQETDAQGFVHHTTYLNYFEIGRVEMLRAAGHSYRTLEDNGLLLVVSEVNCRFFLPARFDDLLTVKTRIVSCKGVRICHEYEIYRDENLIANGSTTVASVGKNGKVKRLPVWLKPHQP